MPESIQEMLTGGHANSLGRTLEVVELVLADSSRLDELFNCYFCDDAVVRLRTSNALKRIEKAEHEWLVPYIKRLLDEVSKIDQASTQWTMANLFQALADDMSPDELVAAKSVLKRNLTASQDWIVLNETMRTLSEWARSDDELKPWLLPELGRLAKDARKSVSGRAKKLAATLS
ncbi:MAG: hypothetical protein JJ850_00465 [Kordiimonadaceae bacterium]|nr:hypothetical protein [Kordiimonadaceae bacterium]MBO6567728.1 hypothetical protein [Kordiimonadaceae bacterium]MBO6963057.1 hypothetical protein [Kordiimonadaceae bacterium]